MKGAIYKFNPDSSCTYEQIQSSKVYALMEKLENGGKPTVTEMCPFGELWHPECYRTGVVRISGWILDFRPYFRRFLIKIKYYGWREVRAYNKTMIRKLAFKSSHILEIIEIKVK